MSVIYLLLSYCRFFFFLWSCCCCSSAFSGATCCSSVFSGARCSSAFSGAAVVSSFFSAAAVVSSVFCWVTPSAAVVASGFLQQLHKLLLSSSTVSFFSSAGFAVVSADVASTVSTWPMVFALGLSKKPNATLLMLFPCNFLIGNGLLLNDFYVHSFEYFLN